MCYPARIVACTVFLFCFVAQLHASTLDDIRERGTLRWGGDASGGGPYIYYGPDNKLVGFEFELADYLAKQLGVSSEYVNWEWEMRESRSACFKAQLQNDTPSDDMVTP
jgi:ABC-type amino acid transport substrate-binding protein